MCVTEYGRAGVRSLPIYSGNCTSTPGVNALALSGDNGNHSNRLRSVSGHGIVSVQSGHPAYRYMPDADGEGIVWA